ncbi:orotate phosphoribosyltransferase [Virgibacillus sp. LDC-1]|uniref:orotate phosphoribosyltransferase n=1 Tax=Virgibacillus sp. LDC-1 TaxID=3039856 RepID=UPI0024DDFDCA|nr:orotate phosphoribosyltransferase [Virgibacillus sp. LDC-1]
MANEWELAQDLLQIKAIQINAESYFTWTSGIQSPIYCDNRLTMSYPAIRKKITDAFEHMIVEMNVKPDIIAGCATAGIPHAAWLADRLDLPMVYVRSKPKGHGKGNQVEGRITPGQKAIVIEDLISTGGSAIETAQVLQRAGVEVIGVLAIFTYGLQVATERFSALQLPLQTITSFDQLVSMMEARGEFNRHQKQKLFEWRQAL